MSSNSKKSKYSKKSTTRKHKNQLGLIDPTVAGIDIGDKLIHVAIPDGKGGAYVKEFGTSTPELHNIADELREAGVTTAVMEATGVYWLPIYEILESLEFKAVLVDAKSVKNVPGRKSDVVDAQWIQTLYSNGLLRAAFRPPRDRIALRQYVRQRQTIIKTRQFSINRMEKSLQLMNIKLSSALSTIGGMSGMIIIRAIVGGERDPVKLAGLRSSKCRQPEAKFIASLTGNYQAEHLFALKQALEQYDFSTEQLKECDLLIQSKLETYPDVVDTPPPVNHKDKKKNGKYSSCRRHNKNDPNFDARELLWRKSGVDFTALPGIQGNSALVIFAELGGANVDKFESPKSFCSWLKTCAGNNISGGKRRKSKKQPCANIITQTLRMASLAAKKSDTAAGAFIRRKCGQTDNLKGIKAGANKIAKMIYYMCAYGWEYYEKGAEQYEREYDQRKIKNLEKKAKSLGYKLVAA